MLLFYYIYIQNPFYSMNELQG